MAALPKWGETTLSDPVDWNTLAEIALDVIVEQRQILHLPLWSALQGCGPKTAIFSARPIDQRPGESLITAFGRHAAGRNLEARRTDASRMTASKRHRRKRKTFIAMPNIAPSFP